MARIPEVQPMVDRAALPNYRQQSTETDLTPIGRGIQIAGQQMERAGAAAMRYYEVKDIEDAHKAWGDAQVALLDTSTELRNRKGPEVADMKPVGSNAPDGSSTQIPGFLDETEKRLKDIYTEKTKGLSARSKEKFDSQWKLHSAVFRNQMSEHYRTEKDKTIVLRAEAQMDTASQNLVQSSTDPAAVELAKQDLIANAALRARTLRLPPEVLQKDIETRLTKSHADAVSLLLSTDRVEEAQGYFEKYKGEIDPRMQDTLNTRLKGRADLAAAQGFVDKLDPADMKGGLSEIRKTLKGEQEERAVNLFKERVNERLNDTALMEKKQVRTAMDDIFKLAESGKFSEMSAYVMKATVPAEHRDNLMRLAASLSAQDTKANAAEDRIQDIQIASDLMKRVDMDPKMDRQDVTLAYAKLGGNVKSPAFTKLMAYKDSNGLRGAIPWSKVESIFKDFNGGKEPTQKQKAAMYSMVTESLVQNAPGTKPSDDDLQKRVAALITSGEYDDGGSWYNPLSWGDPNATAIKAAEKGMLDKWLPDVDSDRRATLETEMLSKGVSPQAIKADPNLVRLYEKDQKGIPLSNTEIKKATWRKDLLPPISEEDLRRRKMVQDQAMAFGSQLDRVLGNNGGK